MPKKIYVTMRNAKRAREVQVVEGSDDQRNLEWLGYTKVTEAAPTKESNKGSK